MTGSAALAAILADLRAGRIAGDELAALADALAAARPRRWVAKAAAARLLDVTPHAVRARCRREASPVPTKWLGSRECVDLDSLVADFDASPPRRRRKTPRTTRTAGVAVARRAAEA